ncbi:MAG: sigma-54 interaction domain-containing protein [Nitrospirota bacterium]
MKDEVKILLVDNDIFISNYLKKFISSFGYKVLCSKKEDLPAKTALINPAIIIYNETDTNTMIESKEALEYLIKRTNSPTLFLYNDKHTELKDNIRYENIIFIKKPINPLELKDKVVDICESPDRYPEERIIAIPEISNDLIRKHSAIPSNNNSNKIDVGYHPQLLLGISNPMKEIKTIIDQIAKTDITVLIGGESGTGKELAARTIYNCSLRRNKPFVKVLCAAIPEGLLESELFGHEKGAFTGAIAKKPGKFEFANHGTIFLDEIGDIPFSLQSKLLQVLQDSEFARVGGGEVKVNVRVVTATNKNLEKAVAEGTFREDLFYRLNVVNVHLPALRERKEDIPLLVNLFLEKFNRQYNKDYPYLSETTLDAFMEYDWPGNVRELENNVKRIVVLGDEEIAVKNLIEKEKHKVKEVFIDNPVKSVENGVEEILLEEEIEEKIGKLTLKEIGREAARKAESEAITMALERTRWNRKEAAQLLGISYKALLYKIKECEVEHSQIN